MAKNRNKSKNEVFVPFLETKPYRTGSNVFCFFLTTLWATWQFFALWCESSGNETSCLHFCFCWWLLKAPSQLGAVWFIMSASGPTPCFKVCPIWLRWCSEHLQLSIRRALICLFHCDLAEPVSVLKLCQLFFLCSKKNVQCLLLAASCLLLSEWQPVKSLGVSLGLR